MPLVSFPKDGLIFDSVVLERITAQVSHRIDPVVTQSLTVDQWRDHMIDSMVYELRATILAEKLAEQTTTARGTTKAYYEEPRSTWQFFKRTHKDSWWLRWFVAHRPIRIKTLIFETPWSKKVKTQQFATFPACPIKMPVEHRGPLVVRYETTSVS